MKKLRHKRTIRLQVKMRQIVWFIDDDKTLQKGVVDNIEIYFVDSGNGVDIDYIIHPILKNREQSTANYYSDFEYNKRFFKSRRRAERALRH